MTRFHYGYLVPWLIYATAVISPAGAQTFGEVVLHSFEPPPNFAHPYPSITRDSGGNLFGVTIQGGPSGQGMVFKIDPTGIESEIYAFTGGADGGYPVAGVTEDPAGNLYGTASYGGASAWGDVFKLNPAGQLSVLYSFTGGPDGGRPFGGVILDVAGNIYGTTSAGGTAGYGVVYKLDPAGQETVLYDFTGALDGGYPYAGLALDASGNLYGTTTSGGTANVGVVFRLSPAGTEKVLYSFRGGADGSTPYAGVALQGTNLFGTTYTGGAASFGVVYKLTAAGQETVLHSFTGGADGSNPYAGVVLDSAGNLYGTTYYGGTGQAGVVYEVDTAGGETVIYAFSGGGDGGFAGGGVTLDPAGDLYGMTAGGGAVNRGAVFELSSGGDESVLYSFTSGIDGFGLNGNLVLDTAGNLYGATQDGGPANAGIVFKLDPAGNETILYTFKNGTDGSEPWAGLIRDAAGNLYGTTFAGGAVGYGTVFKLDPAGQETVLHSFTGGDDGAQPYGGVVQDAAGNLYGATPSGGAGFAGIVFKVSPAGQETVLYSFTGLADGGTPQGGVAVDTAGNVYGTTYFGGADNAGVVFKVDPAGGETVLHSFTGFPNDGANPEYGNVILDSAGNVYGTTTSGGSWNAGVVFKVDPVGNETVLFSFNGEINGYDPLAGVSRDAAGNLYGTTFSGGTGGLGIAYKLSATGAETTLTNFAGGVLGGYPVAGIIPDTAGNLYGTASYGGAYGGGVAYALRLQPSMAAPAPGITLSESQADFTWIGVAGVTEYQLTAGTTPGGSNIFSGTTAGTSLSVNGIPCADAVNGTIYVQLSAEANGVFSPAVDYTYKCKIGLGDFNGDGYQDLIWQNTSTHQATVHYYDGSPDITYIGWNWLNSGGEPDGWVLVGAADFDGNGVPDLVWEYLPTGQVTVNYYGGVGGATLIGWNWLNMTGNPGWTVTAVADVNGDGVPDLIWENNATNQVTVNYYGGAGGAVYQSWAWLNSGGEPAGWHVVGTADFDGNGTPDLVWEYMPSGQVTVNYYGGSGGATYQGWNWLNETGNPGWTVAGASDFNSDGVPDLVWQNNATAQVSVNYYGGAGGAILQGWNWLANPGYPGWTVVVPR